MSYETLISTALPWIVSFLCLFISYQWISPTVWTFVCLRARNKVSEESEEKKTSAKLKQTSVKTIPIYAAAEQENNAEVNNASYDESWFASPQVFDLEQRAIFSKTWLFAFHRSQFAKPGDYYTIALASFSIFLILGQDQKIRAFHNVCRHRAYTITKKASGSSTVLGCRYHGWSYNTRGNLVKAPEFEGIPGFNKKLNGLFEIRTKVTSEGCVFVNFDADEVVPVFKFEQLKDMRSRKIERCQWVSGWNLDGNFNWKVAGCVEDDLDLGEDALLSKWPSIFPLFKRADRKALGFSPGTVFHLSPSRKTWISVRYIPQTATKTTIKIDLYTSIPKSHQSNMLLESHLKAHFQDRLKQLEETHASIVQDGVRKANLSRQDDIHSLLVAHLRMERSMGREIHPAIRAEAFSEIGRQDDDLCKEIENGIAQSLQSCLPSSDTKDVLKW